MIAYFEAKENRLTKKTKRKRQYRLSIGEKKPVNSVHSFWTILAEDHEKVLLP